MVPTCNGSELKLSDCEQVELPDSVDCDAVAVAVECLLFLPTSRAASNTPVTPSAPKCSSTAQRNTVSHAIVSTSTIIPPPLPTTTPYSPMPNTTMSTVTTEVVLTPRPTVQQTGNMKEKG